MPNLGWCQRHRDLIAAALLFFLPVLLFAPSLPYDFVNWDDYGYVLENAWLLNFTPGRLWQMFTVPCMINYHPLTMLSYTLDFQLWGLEPCGYRLTNLLLHGAVVAAGFGLFRQLGIPLVPAFFLLLFFAIHPLRLESVIWISERKDVLCALFYVAAIWAWVRAGDESREHRWLYISLLLALLSFLAKAMAVSIVGVVIVHDFLLKRSAMKRRIPVYLALVLLSILFSWLNLQAQGVAIRSGGDFLEKLVLSFYVPFHYLGTTIWPYAISPFYPYGERPTRALIVMVLSMVGGSAAIVGIFWTAWVRPAVGWGLLSAAGILFPVSGIITYGTMYAADRYSYLPTLFVLLAIGIASAKWWNATTPSIRKVWGFTALLICLLLGIASMQLMPIWRNTETLWTRVYELYPDAGMGKGGLARIYHERLTEPVRVPTTKYGMVHKMSWVHAGIVESLIRTGRLEEALEHTKTMRRDRTTYQMILRVHRLRGTPKEGLGIARTLIKFDPKTVAPEIRAEAVATVAAVGRDEEALTALRAIPSPTYMGSLAHAILGENALNAGDLILAEQHARSALDIHPAQLDALKLIQQILVRANREAEATELWKRALRHKAASDEVKLAAIRSLAKYAETDGDGGEAKRLLEQSYELDFEDEVIFAKRAGLLEQAAQIAETLGDEDHAAERRKEARRILEFTAH